MPAYYAALPAGKLTGRMHLAPSEGSANAGKAHTIGRDERELREVLALGYAAGLATQWRLRAPLPIDAELLLKQKHTRC